VADRKSAPAHAKINLILEVGGRREDGYHEIDTVLQEIGLADQVTVSWGEFDGVRVGGPFAEGTPADKTNLAWRAAASLAGICGQSFDGLGITLEKRIPPAGGLGGGASDAATTLRLVQERWNATEAQLLEAANAVGSDEAFFLVGGAARARGRGERVEPLSALRPHDVVLFIPAQTIEHKTARLFAELDALPAEPLVVAKRFAHGQRTSITSGEVVNSFERVAREVFEGLGGLWDELERRCGEPVHLAGAGPTLFWIGEPGRGSRVAAEAAGTPCQVIESRTIVAHFSANE
jgi:4-diphosphocytidyl-2-C-methyl-D-erythritol kinase